jgi:hypothetical protein
MRMLWYRLKIQATWTWGALLFLHGFLLFLLFQDALRPAEAPRHWLQASFILEVFLPLALALLLAPIPALDRSTGLAELHLSHRRPALLQLLGHLALPLLLWAVVLGLTGWVIDRYYAAVPLREFLALTLYPAGALGGAALAGGALARHPVGGVMISGLWSALDLLFPGVLNRFCYLFSYYQPVQGLDLATMQGRMAALGALGCLLALWLAGRRARWVQERAA